MYRTKEATHLNNIDHKLCSYNTSNTNTFSVIKYIWNIKFQKQSPKNEHQIQVGYFLPENHYNLLVSAVSGKRKLHKTKTISATETYTVIRNKED